MAITFTLSVILVCPLNAGQECSDILLRINLCVSAYQLVCLSMCVCVCVVGRFGNVLGESYPRPCSVVWLSPSLCSSKKKKKKKPIRLSTRVENKHTPAKNVGKCWLWVAASPPPQASFALNYLLEVLLYSCEVVKVAGSYFFFFLRIYQPVEV